MKLISFTLAVYDKLLQKGYSGFIVKSTIKGADRDYCNGRALQVFQPASNDNSYKVSIDKLKELLQKNDADYYVLLSTDL